MNRRQFIKGLLSLAVLAAAGHAVGARALLHRTPVESWADPPSGPPARPVSLSTLMAKEHGALAG